MTTTNSMSPLKGTEQRIPQERTMQNPIVTQMRDSHPLMRSTALLVLLCFTTVFYTPGVKAAIDAYEQWSQQPAEDHTVYQELQTLLDAIQLTAQLAGGALSEMQWQNKREHLQQQLEQLVALSEQVTEEQHREQARRAKTITMERTLKRLERRDQKGQVNLQLVRQGLQYAIEQEKPQQAVKILTRTAGILARVNAKRYRSYDNFMPFGPLDAVAPLPAASSSELCARLQLAEPCYSSEGPITTDQVQSVDVELTAAIIEQTQLLGNDPVAIYNWVYNQIQFIPSFGSIQGADMTLQTRRGNAMDTASLLIALLRAAGTPARYHYGSIEMRPADVKNWVGNVTESVAASNLLAQGGIPGEEVRQDGRLLHYRLEHTWVQAWIDNQWVELDASFKYHHPEAGLDLPSAVPFDANAFVEQLQASATVNENEGWVQNVDQQLIETQMADYRNQLETYLTNNHADATVGEVIGQRRLIERTAATLPDELRHQNRVASATFSEVPNHLRHQFGFTLFDQYDNELLTRQWYTSELAAKNVALSFTPATEADEKALFDLLPDNPQTPEELPDTIPADAFDVKAQLTVNGEVVAESAAIPFGRELKTRKGFWSERNGWEQTDNPVVTGSYQAIGVDLQGVSPKHLKQLKSRMEATKTQLEAEQFNSLTKHEVAGDLLQAGVWSYLALTNVQSQLMAQTANMVYYREPSYGSFQTQAVLNTFAGSPQSVTFTGLLMDMDSMKSSTECKRNCWDNWVNFNRSNGQMLSAYEHIVPEQLFSTVENPVEAVSAVKAIAVAARQGQRIYTFTQDNRYLIDGLSIDQGTKDEIKAAVQAGKEATVHEAPLDYAGWRGVGYIIVDPTTGAGAYKISGGADGGFVKGLGYVTGMIAIVALSGGMGMIGAPILVSLVVAFHVLLIAAIVSITIDNDYNAGQVFFDFLCGIALAFSVAAAVNLWAKALAGAALASANTIGATMTIAGASKSSCGGF